MENTNVETRILSRELTSLLFCLAYMWVTIIIDTSEDWYRRDIIRDIAISDHICAQMGYDWLFNYMKINMKMRTLENGQIDVNQVDHSVPMEQLVDNELSRIIYEAVIITLVSYVFLIRW